MHTWSCAIAARLFCDLHSSRMRPAEYFTCCKGEQRSALRQLWVQVGIHCCWLDAAQT